MSMTLQEIKDSCAGNMTVQKGDVRVTIRIWHSIVCVSLWKDNERLRYIEPTAEELSLTLEQLVDKYLEV